CGCGRRWETTAWRRPVRGCSPSGICATSPSSGCWSRAWRASLLPCHWPHRHQPACLCALLLRCSGISSPVCLPLPLRSPLQPPPGSSKERKERKERKKGRRAGMSLTLTALTRDLSPQLKQLRLSGILATLEARHRQALDGQWSYVEFLERLLEDEVERRAQKQLALRLHRAAVNTTKTLESFDWHFNPSLNRQQVLQLASGDYLRRKRTVLRC